MCNVAVQTLREEEGREAQYAVTRERKKQKPDSNAASDRDEICFQPEIAGCIYEKKTYK